MVITAIFTHIYIIPYFHDSNITNLQPNKEINIIDHMMYETIIIGAGAAGLFCAAHMTDKSKRVIVLEGSNRPGLKLLVSSSGQCNFTHGGSMEDYLDKYGQNGRKIRKVLNTYTNQDVIEFFEKAGLKTWEREDGKVFPASKKAQDVLDVLMEKIKANGVEMRYGAKVLGLREITEGNEDKPRWQVQLENGESIEADNVVVATGGITYPKTGSDGSMFQVLENLGGVKINKPGAALAPIFVEGYGFTGISGVSIGGCVISKIQEKVKKKDRVDDYKEDLLFTHKNLSGPLILNYSRYLNNGDKFKIDFLPEGFHSGDHLPYKGCRKNILNLLGEETGLPKAFLELVAKRAAERFLKASGEQVDCQLEKLLAEKAASLPGNFLKQVEELIRGYQFTVSGKGALDVAMVTAGGVPMGEVSPGTMELKKHPGLHLAGEILDVDGNTGGYNIQFAFSSSYIAAQHILQLP